MARGRKSPYTLFLAPMERAELERWQRSTTIQAGVARRAKIMLWRADGLALSAIARRLGMGRRMVRKWRQRVLNKRIPGLSDNPGRGRQPGFSPRRRGPSRQAGWRATGEARPVPLPVGRRRAGPATGTGGARRAYVSRDGAPTPGASQTEALAAPCMAVPPDPAGRRVLCPGRRGGGAVYAAAAGRCQGLVSRGEDLLATPSAPPRDAARPTRPPPAGGARGSAGWGAASLRRLRHAHGVRLWTGR